MDDHGFGAEVMLDRPAWLHPTALVYGRVRLGEGVTLWPYATIRSENHEVTIGPYTNLQDHVMVHVADDFPTHVGAWCSITHHATLHGCTIGDHVLIGINAVVMDGAVVGDNCIIGAGAVVSPGQVIPPGSIAAGVPARVLRQKDVRVGNHMNAFFYWQNGLAYARGEHRMAAGEAFREAAAAEAARFAASLGLAAAQ